MKDKRFRDPGEFLSREAKDRYVIPIESTVSKSALFQSHSIEDIHRDFLVNKYNLSTLGTLFKELDDDYTKTHKQIYFD